MFLLIISRLHDILILSFPVKMNMDVMKIRIEYRNFRRKGDFEQSFRRFYENLGGISFLDFRSDHHENGDEYPAKKPFH